VVAAWLKKYTLVGACLFKDKKYLLKEFLFIGVYAISCLGINHLIIWPVAVSLALLTLSFVTWDIFLKKMERCQTENNENKINV
jgi:hypothetical protein